MTKENSNNPLVSISCVTYNHAPYIRQCLDGFINQKTNFPFEILVHDDASTDGTANIIEEYQKKYPELIKAICRKENQFSKGIRGINVRYNFPRAKGKYIAMCEGDDFWIDEYKLQKQYDFLERNPDHVLCCHDWNVLKEDETQSSPVRNMFDKDFSFTFETLPWTWITKTATLFFRNNLFDFNKLLTYNYNRDVHIVYYTLKYGKGRFMKDIMANYRVLETGFWSGSKKNEKERTTYNLYKELFSLEPNKATKRRYMNAALAYSNVLIYAPQSLKNWLLGIKIYIKSITLMQSAKDLTFLAGALMPPSIVKLARKIFNI